MKTLYLKQLGLVAVALISGSLSMADPPDENNRNTPRPPPHARGVEPVRPGAASGSRQPASAGRGQVEPGRPDGRYTGQRPESGNRVQGGRIQAGGSRSIYASQVRTRTFAAQRGGAPILWHGLAGGGGVARTQYGTGRAVRFGAVGFTEQRLANGRINRTYVVGGQVSHNRVFEPRVWSYGGRALSAAIFVPTVTYRPEYFRWAVTAWAKPVSYNWRWEGQGWYTRYAYAGLFVPYDTYDRLDLWMTDYIVAESLRMSYEAQDAAIAAQSSDEQQAAPSAQDTASPPPADPVAENPPAVTEDVKNELDDQIRVQLEEQAEHKTSSIPPALRPNHTLFQVVEPLNVNAGAPQRLCSLGAEDYIKRTGDIDPQDNTVAVVVELSRDQDCPVGLATRVSFNDLADMENEQEARVAEAMNAASKSMGSDGLPSTPLAQPLVASNDSVPPDQNAADQMRKM
ncbi:MAG TPA: hypothetical protein VGV09_01455 [Steroidobacteraceae bacterium]|nr:hypothetical protein [Steroidobacteraceae bacterium]